MIKIDRLDAPEWLLGNWEQWGKDFAASGKKFRWRFANKKYKELTGLLKKMTNHHCSYCDNFPVGRRNIKDTIDHFRPKENYKLLAYLWENLFISCHYCQERNADFDERLLKPDEADYNFDEYFSFDFTSKSFQTPQNQQKTKNERESPSTFFA